MQSSINGKMASYSLTNDSLAALEATQEAIYRGYAPVAEFTYSLPMTDDLQEQKKQWLTDVLFIGPKEGALKSSTTESSQKRAFTWMG
jgi:hypothetical protein